MAPSDTVHPEVTWAQRSSTSDPTRNIIYLTIAAPDVPKSGITLDLQPTKLVFSGKSTTKNVTYACDLEFFAEVDPKESKINHTDRDIEMVLRKKEEKEEYWPRLLKEKKKAHFLQTDWDKWVDEDEQNPTEDEDWMAKAGGGLGGGEGGFEGIDFSKFGSGPGGPAGGMPSFDDEDDEDMDDDEEMPGLEGEEDEVEEVTGKGKEPASASAATGGAKIEEVE